MIGKILSLLIDKLPCFAAIIGHFGLGFYSAFMVADEVHIDSLSWQEGAQPVFHIKRIIHIQMDPEQRLFVILEYLTVKFQILFLRTLVRMLRPERMGLVEQLRTLLVKGVIDCPDLPLNVSRSALQNDGFVKKISEYITKKVADKLSGMCKTENLLLLFFVLPGIFFRLILNDLSFYLLAVLINRSGRI